MVRPPPTLRQRALEWLAQREHSRQELRDKLLRWVQALETAAGARVGASRDAALGASDAAGAGNGGKGGNAAPGAGSLPDQAQSAGRPLRGCGRPLPRAEDVEPLLDELQAAGHLSEARFVESRVHARAARYGNRRIEQELRRHGTAPPPPLREALHHSELQRAREVWSRKFGQPPQDLAERARQMRFLAGRGFTPETIRRVLRAGDARGPGDDADAGFDPEAAAD